MKSKLLSSFLGGFLGILLSGYAYYLSGKHHFFLVPIGVFGGSLAGFFWFNLKEIVDKTKAFNRYFIKLKIEKTFSPFYKFLDWISSIEIQLNVNKFFKYFIAIIHTLKLFVKIFFNMFKKPIIWIKAHPMNFYLLMEILMLLAITASVVFLIIKYDILREPVSFLNLIIILSMVSGVIGYIIFIFEKDSRTFYADWQFYSRYSLFGVLIKSIARALFCAAVASIGFVTILSGILVFSFYAITLLILSFLLIGIIGLITYILKLANNHKELSSFVVTMMITVISYFIYRNRFMEEILIWLAAFGTGSISSFTVQFILNLDKGWVVKNLETVYLFLTGDSSDMEKVATYKQDWTGVMVFMLGNWVIKNIYGRIFTLAENTTDTINIKIR